MLAIRLPLILVVCLAFTSAAIATEDGWYESNQYPGWWVRYEGGRVAQWQQMPKKGPAQQVDRDAVLRLGNWIHHVDGTKRDDLAGLWGQVMGPPASDSHKWFISVIGQQKSGACKELKDAWAVDEQLRALAKPELESQKDSWAHFNWYDKDDDTQQWRWKALEITGYPTIVVQPPRRKNADGTGIFGDPKTVVFQQTWGKGSTPKRLADDIRDGIKRYLASLPRQELHAADDNVLPASGVIAAPPPNHVKPKTDAPVDPTILPPDPSAHKQIPPKSPSIIPGGDLFAWAKANWLLIGGAVVLLLLFKDKIKASLWPAPAPLVQAPAPVVQRKPPQGGSGTLPALSVDEAVIQALTEYAKREAAEIEARRVADESRAKVKATMLEVAKGGEGRP